MKKLITAATFLFFLASCGGSEEQTPVSENDIDAARNFIDAALRGHWRDARKLLVQDSVNLELLELAENNYTSHMNREDKRGYNEATINILSTRSIDAATSVIHYSNSFKKKEDSLKVVKQRDEWLIDLKYSFPQTDTAIYVQ